jgi:hypothetical protein
MVAVDGGPREGAPISMALTVCRRIPRMVERVRGASWRISGRSRWNEAARVKGHSMARPASASSTRRRRRSGSASGARGWATAADTSVVAGRAPGRHTPMTSGRKAATSFRPLLTERFDRCRIEQSPAGRRPHRHWHRAAIRETPKMLCRHVQPPRGLPDLQQPSLEHAHILERSDGRLRPTVTGAGLMRTARAC